ncbi:MAG TPA: hypothetical protein PKC28_07185 [Bdellovibrionales bacterium]|nr:hypothetical protein [Bdellovibrionales bacterium]
MSLVTEIYPKWSGAVPATLLFGPGGVLLEAWEGDTSLEEFQTKVQQHLGDQ